MQPTGLTAYESPNCQTYFVEFIQHSDIAIVVPYWTNSTPNTSWHLIVVRYSLGLAYQSSPLVWHSRWQLCSLGSPCLGLKEHRVKARKWSVQPATFSKAVPLKDSKLCSLFLLVLVKEWSFDRTTHYPAFFLEVS